jgi:hypothetical protein
MRTIHRMCTFGQCMDDSACVKPQGCGGRGAVDGCVFDSPGGNGLLVEGRTVGMRVTENEFKWVGDSAIVVG